MQSIIPSGNSDTHKVDISVSPWNTAEYKAIYDFYHDREGSVIRINTNKISGMNPVIEGVFFLTEILPTDEEFVKAFLLHPIFCDPKIEVHTKQEFVTQFDLPTSSVSAALRMAHYANQFLPNDFLAGKNPPNVEEKGIRFMLMAQKAHSLKELRKIYNKENPIHTDIQEYLTAWVTTLGCYTATFESFIPQLKEKFG